MGAVHLAHAQIVTGPTNFNFQNITLTGATLTITPGADDYASIIQSRQPVNLKYRAVSPNEGNNPSMNGSEKVVPLEYTINSNNPFQPVVFTGLKENQRYAVWFGHQSYQQCLSDTPCTALYMKYDLAPVFFSTKLDASTVATITKNLSFQTKSPSVALLKKFLVAQGYMTTGSGTTFDIPTLVGVLKFQIAQNMTTDGVVGSSSRAMINQWLINQSKQ